MLKQLWQAKTGGVKPVIESSKISRILQLATVEEVLHEKAEWLPRRAFKKIANWKIAAILILIAISAWAVLYWTLRR